MFTCIHGRADPADTLVTVEVMELKLVPYSAALFLEQLFSSNFDSFMAPFLSSRVRSKSPVWRANGEVCRRAAKFCRKHFKFRTSCRTGPLHALEMIPA
jgi:hypothetical protein